MLLLLLCKKKTLTHCKSREVWTQFGSHQAYFNHTALAGSPVQELLWSKKDASRGWLWVLAFPGLPLYSHGVSHAFELHFWAKTASQVCALGYAYGNPPGLSGLALLHVT